MHEEYDRALLFEEVWAEPVSTVAPRYGVSDVGLKKLCARLQIPTPARGHWAKVKAGRGIPPKSKLKTYKGNPRYLLKPVAPQPSRPVELEVVDERLTALLAYEQDPANRIVVPARVTRWNPLVAATRDAFRAEYKDGRGMPLPGGKSFDISVSLEQRVRALRVANTLVRALEKRGFKLVPGKHHIEVELFGVLLSLCFFESSRRSDYVPTEQERATKARGEWSHWPRYKYTPSGRLEVRCNGGYGGSVKDGVHQLVEEQLNKLIILMAKHAISILRFREESAHAEEVRLTLRREALAQQAVQDAEKQKLESLKVTAVRWQQAQAIRDYLGALERTAVSSSEELSRAQKDYLTWAHAKADWLDPLVAALDPILDQDIRIPY